MAQVLRHLPTFVDERVLVGTGTADDAAVYRMSDELAIVATVDYITPIVDDPYAWGAIAAANALSDVYAMGAQPLFALNLVNFPRDRLPLETLHEVLRGGAEKAAEAGIGVVGGHSIDDPEPKYGMVVLGGVHPDRVVRNVGARPGDTLLLTKPLGTGVISTAIKQGQADEKLVGRAIEVMSTLNRTAAEVMVEYGHAVHAATDISGFGLLGHLAEMLRPDSLGARLISHEVPVIEGALDLVRKDAVPSGTRRNLDSVLDLVDWAPNVPDEQRLLLADAQTSGGLLMAVDPEAADAILTALRQRGVVAVAAVGVCTADSRIEVA